MSTKTYPENIKKQGWEQMNMILEKEMPRSDKKRRLILFFLVLGILSTGGILFSKKYLINSPGKTEPQKQEIRKNKFLPNNEPIASGDLFNEKIPLKPDNYRENHLKYKSAYKPSKQILSELKENSNYPEQTYKTTISNNEPLKSENEKTETNHDFSIISAISNIGNKKLISQRNDFLKGLTVNLHVKPTRRFLNPFIETKAFNKSSKKADPGIEFCIGNTFLLSPRMYIDLAAGLADPGLMGNSILLLQSYKSDASGTLNLGNTDNKTKNALSGGLVELSVFQGYRVNRKLSLKGGGGISFTKLLSSNIIYENSKSELTDSSVEFIDERNNTYRFSQDGLIPAYSFFAEANAGYKVFKGLSLVAGYKHYFREYNVVTDIGNESIYRVYFQQPDIISDFYLGLRYDFRK